MNLWLEHPRYVRTRDRLIAQLRSDRYRFRRLEPVVFLCGAARSPARDTLFDYLKRHRPTLGLFYAERAWEHIASRPGVGALKVEADLAALADLVLIIVESPGTFAELGAFSLSDPLRKKLLPVVDRTYKNSESFLATGPLRWTDAESDFRPTVYTPISRILEAVAEIEERLARIPKSRPVRLADLTTSPKHLLFFLCDLIALLHPVTLEILDYYVRSIAPSLPTTNIDVPTLISLAVAMGLLTRQVNTVDNHEVFFLAPAAANALERPYHHRCLLDLPSIRADHISVLLTIPQAAAVLSRTERLG